MAVLENKEIKKRVKNLFFVGFILFLVLLGYYFWYINFPKLALKCIFYEITGLHCPGCGITRMLASFLRFDFVKGIKYNIFLGVTLPFIVGIIIYSCYLYIVDKKSGKGFNIICYVYVVMLIVWSVVRNLIGI